MENVRTKTATFEIVDEANYLGQKLSFEERTEKEISARIEKAWKYWSLKSIFKGPYKNYHKSQIFNMCVVPKLTYMAVKPGH